MNGHGHVIPNADGTKARCGGPGLCGECSSELATLTGHAPSGLTAREACARAALSLIGYSLVVRHHNDGRTTCTITDNPDDPAETALVYTSMEQVEQFIATNTRITAAAERAVRLRDVIRGLLSDIAWDTPVNLPAERKPAVGDIVHYVSYGTPGGEFGRECRAAIVTELAETEGNEQNPAGDGIFRHAVGLCVLNPTGQFFNRGVLHAPGTFTGPAREATGREWLAGMPLPAITCADLEFPGGTWHWAGEQ
jgi:hypothetical protein